MLGGSREQRGTSREERHLGLEWVTKPSALPSIRYLDYFTSYICTEVQRSDSQAVPAQSRCLKAVQNSARRARAAAESDLAARQAKRKAMLQLVLYCVR